MCVPVSVTVGGAAVGGGLAPILPQIICMAILAIVGFLSLAGKRLIK